MLMVVAVSSIRSGPEWLLSSPQQLLEPIIDEAG
jgi:hypothetical protein